MEKQLTALINGIVSEIEYTLIDLVIRGEKGSKILEVYVDGRHGVDLDSLSVLSKKINRSLENSGEYKFSKITVSSPGVDRNIKYHWQFYKHVGRKITVELNDGKTVTGKLLSVNDELDLEIEPSFKNKKKKDIADLKVVKLNFSDVKNSRVLISF